MHSCVGKEEGEAPRIFGKAASHLSPFSNIPSLQGLLFPAQEAWLVKPCGNATGFSGYIEDVMGTPLFLVVTIFKGFTAYILL